MCGQQLLVYYVIQINILANMSLIVYVLFNGEKLIGFETITRKGTDETAACFHVSF